MAYGMYRNATAQYKAIEQKIVQAQKLRDSLLQSISNSNAKLNTLKFNIEEIINSFEFKEKVYTDIKGTPPLNYKEIKLGLKFDAAKGQLLTNSSQPISDAVSFLNIQGSKAGTFILTSEWKSLRTNLLDSLKKYRQNLNEISSNQIKLNDQQKRIDDLKKELDIAAQNDPALIKAKQEAESREREAKVKADVETERLRITTEQEKQKEKKKKTFVILAIGGVAALGIIYYLTKRK